MRADFCIPPENLTRNQDLLECTLSAKQCGSYIALTKDPKLAAVAVEPLSRTLQPMTIVGWLGGEQEQLVEGHGACETLGSEERYRGALWNEMGLPTLKNAYQGVAGAIAREDSWPAPPPEDQRYLLADPPFGSPQYFLRRYVRETQVPKSLR